MEKKRQVEFDYVKTIAIFFMVIIHVIEELSTVEFNALPAGFWENFIQFGAGPVAAPAFVFAMGVGMVFSRSQEPEQLFERGIKLWIVAMGLNLCRDVVPRFLFSLISGTPLEWETLRYQIFNIDILHFAGLAFILPGLFKKINVPVLALVPIGVLMQAAGSELSLAFQPTGIAEIILSYFFNTGGELSCFPLLIWYASLTVGILAGTIIKENTDHLTEIYNVCLWGGGSLLIGFIVACHYNQLDIRYLHALYEDAFYKQTFFNFLYNTLIIIVELAVLHIITGRLKEDIDFFDFCGRNLTTIYVVQWMIIGWMASFQPYLNFEPGLEMSVAVGFAIAGISILITKLLPRIKW